MKSFFLLLIPFILLSLSGCAPKYDYTVHKPKVKYKKPSKDALARTLKEKLGTDYVWAEEGPKAFDCSGLTYYSYGRMNMTIPRVAREQAKVGQKVPIDALQYGDLVFFNTTKRRSRKVTHVGIYIGDGKFQHASSSTEGVIISDLNSSYYKPRVVVCKRYLPSDKVTPSTIPTTPINSYMLAQSETKTTVTPLDIQEHTIQQVMRTPSQTTVASGKHYIQVGTFANEPSSGLFQQIKSNGYQYKILQASSMKKVLIGPYQTKAEALKYLDEVRATILPDAFTVKI
jgi:hypothetical protein